MQQDKPIHCEMIKLIKNPLPNSIAVRKKAIIVSKTKVYKSDLKADPAAMPSVAGFMGSPFNNLIFEGVKP
jgi:hypothetical protein